MDYDADFIDRNGNAYTVLAISLAPYYESGRPEQRSQIDRILDCYYHLCDSELEANELLIRRRRICGCIDRINKI